MSKQRAETEAPSFKPGDIVQHVSGGPLMAVFEFDEDYGGVRCSWFWNGRHRHADFATCELVVADEAVIQALPSRRALLAGLGAPPPHEAGEPETTAGAKNLA